jgi:hypothetical protein
MVDLVPYVTAQLKKGFKQSSIKEILLKYGHNAEDIDKAIDAAYHPQVQQIHHTLHLSWTTIIGISFIIIMAISGAWIGIKLAKPTEQLLDIEANPKFDTYKPGDEVVFVINLVNLGKDNRYDLTLKHEMFEPNGFIMNEKEETVAIETRGSVESRIKIPNMASPGKYKIRTTAYYQGQNAKTSFTINVISDATVTSTTDTSTTKEIATTIIKTTSTTSTTNSITTTTLPIETCEDNIWNQDEEDVDCGGKYCDPCKKAGQEITNDLKKYSNANDMMKYCISLLEPENIDICFLKIAKKYNEPKYCGPISDSKRDDCYIWFATQENFYSDKEMICNLIINENKKDICGYMYRLIS